jgi:hypothetical protein
MADVARFDFGRRHRREDIGGAETRIDDGLRAEFGAEPPIALDQRRQGADRGARVERFVVRGRPRGIASG